MTNVFKPVRIKGKLFGKHVASGEIVGKDVIRHVQLLHAEKHNEVLIVSPTGRVTRMAVAGAAFTAQAWYLLRVRTVKAASRLMFGSFIYLPVVQIAMLIDKF